MPVGAREPATLHVVCGKLAAGKTTLARQIAASAGAVLISEDLWLSRLFPGNPHWEFQEYLTKSANLRSALAPHVVDLLSRGISVVFDFAGNHPRHRQWVRSIVEEAGASHVLHYLNVPDEVCKQRLHRRNAEAPEGSQQTTDEEFDAITAHFVPPTADEGFVVREYGV